MHRYWDLYVCAKRRSIFGEGQGIITTKDGQGITTWTGQGIGKFTAPEKVSFRGSIFFRTPSTSEGGKLSSLNNMAGVFEYEVDETGSCSLNLGSGSRCRLIHT
jgi:hypothetical protein